MGQYEHASQLPIAVAYGAGCAGGGVVVGPFPAATSKLFEAIAMANATIVAAMVDGIVQVCFWSGMDGLVLWMGASASRSRLCVV